LIVWRVAGKTGLVATALRKQYNFNAEEKPPAIRTFSRLLGT
jgi:hypothetical protein